MDININKEVEAIQDYIINKREQFHQYPELALQEFHTTEMIIEEFEKMEIPYKRLEPTGAVGFLGRMDGRIVALRADIDGLLVTEETGLSCSSKLPGHMHACGHDGHIAGLLGAARILKKYEGRLTIGVKLIFQPAEENSAGAALVMEQGYLDNVEEIFGIHIFSDIPVGRISIEAGPRMAATDHFTIRIEGKAGHAAKPHECIDATIVAAAMVMNLQTVVSRRINPIEDAVLTIGRMESGTAYNVISGQAVLEGTVRTFSVDTEERIKELICQIAEDTASLYGAEATVDYPKSAHPPLVNDKKIADRVYKEAADIFPEYSLESIPKIMLGEDFSNYLEKISGAFAFIGGGKNDGSINYLNHHSKFDFDEKALFNAVKMHLAYVKSALHCEKEHRGC
jgi:amidohydrolase